jgi:hypothetical protein
MSVYYSNICKNAIQYAVCLNSVLLEYFFASNIMNRYNMRHMFTAHGCAFFVSVHYSQKRCGRNGGVRRARDDANGPTEIFYERILQID